MHGAFGGGKRSGTTHHLQKVTPATGVEGISAVQVLLREFRHAAT
jgi:hypothetical protein